MRVSRVGTAGASLRAQDSTAPRRRLRVGRLPAAVPGTLEVDEVVERPQDEVQQVDVLAHAGWEQARGQGERPGDALDRRPRLGKEGGDVRVAAPRQHGVLHSRHRRRCVQPAAPVSGAPRRCRNG